MQADTIDYAKGETPMTDYQFQCYKELRDRTESELHQELSRLRANYDAQTRELEQLRHEVARLKSEKKQSENND